MSKKINLDDIFDFVNKNIIQIIYLVLTILFISLIFIYYFNVREKRTDELILKYYDVVFLSDVDREKTIENLKEIYNSKHADDNIKTIVGIKLSQLLFDDDKLKILLEVYEKDGNFFLKNLAGVNALSILVAKNNPDNYSQIEKLLKKVRKPQNPLLNLVLEQEAIFELQKGNQQKADGILEQLLTKEIDDDTRMRLRNILEIRN